MFILPEIWRQRSATCKTTFIYDANDAEDADVANSASGDGDMPTVSRGGEPNCWGTGQRKRLLSINFHAIGGSSHLHNWLEQVGLQLQDFSYKHLS